MKRPLVLLALLSLASLTSAACGSDDDPAPAASGGSGGSAGGSAGEAGSGGGDAGQGGSDAGTGGSDAGAGGDAGQGGAGPSPLCEELGLPSRAFDGGAPGKLRGQLAGDFTLPLLGGSSWTFSSSFPGCASYIFLPDALVVSQQDPTSLWTADLPELLQRSPRTVHYFFVSRSSSAETAATRLQEMSARIDDALAALEPGLAAHWKAHLHVVGKRAAELDNWVGEVLQGHGAGGFAIDRRQRVRGIGSLADVTRFDSALQQANLWPWKGNLAYAAHEAAYFDAQAKLQEALDSEEVTQVSVFNGEILEQFAEQDIELPSAEVMATFDTLQIEIESMCPDPQKGEFGNCGAWDYLAILGIDAGEGKFTEIARFITSYHRETRWVVDASPMLALMKQGGKRRIRWDFAPEWNKQPTATRMVFRLSSRGKEARPSEATFLFSGGSFDPAYNDRDPVVVPIPADAKKVEIYAILTGHGSDAFQCAEFCAHQHEFQVNGKSFSRKFKEAGSQEGCIPQVSNGMVPNQGGTWWFGRGGWCPGQQVEPWVIDVTAQVTPGQDATLTYQGAYGGGTPFQKMGDIRLSSYLVISR
jgi:hypothetical protein